MALPRTTPLGGRYCSSTAVGGFAFYILHASMGRMFEVPGSWPPGSPRK